MIPYIIMILSLLLDGLITNYTPYLVNNLSYFTPLLTLVSILLIYPFFRKDRQKYFIIAFILGFLYDLFYTNLFFFNAVLFLVIAYLNTMVQKWTSNNAFNLLVQAIGTIILYESLTGLVLFIYNMVPISFYKVYYKVIHSLALNVIYVEIIYFIIKLIPKRYKRISIN